MKKYALHTLEAMYKLLLVTLTGMQYIPLYDSSTVYPLPIKGQLVGTQDFALLMFL